jgi:hypothetical protein
MSTTGVDVQDHYREFDGCLTLPSPCVPLKISEFDSPECFKCQALRSSSSDT